MAGLTMKNTRSAFTLIELIVVITIIAVLVGILTPILASSKRAAKIEVGKKYLRQQFMMVEMYAMDAEGKYPGYSDVMGSTSLQAPCSPLYDWMKPCWSLRREFVDNPVDSNGSPMVGGRGYIYALKDWEEIDRLGNDKFLGWDRSKPYPVFIDIFAATYRVKEFEGSSPDPRDCTVGNSDNLGCYYPEKMWFGYSDGSLRVTRQAVAISDGKPRQLFDWFHVFTRQMDLDTMRGQ
jgi:prepilin-type N-terminal cleavage/methylation domain-containing protein